MATLPQLIEEDIRRLDDTLRELLAQTDATVASVCASKSRSASSSRRMSSSMSWGKVAMVQAYCGTD